MADSVYQEKGLETTGCLQEALEEAKLEGAPSAYRHAEGAKVAARNLLAKPRSTGNEETWNTLVALFLPQTSPPCRLPRRSPEWDPMGPATVSLALQPGWE